MSKSLKLSFERWPPITYSILHVFPAWSLWSYFRKTEQVKQIKIIPRALGNAKHSQKSCHRPSELAIWIRAYFCHWCPNIVPETLTAKVNNATCPRPLHLSWMIWGMVPSQIAVKLSERWWKKITILHLELDYKLHKVCSHRLEWVAVNFMSPVPCVHWLKQKPAWNTVCAQGTGYLLLTVMLTGKTSETLQALSASLKH